RSYLMNSQHTSHIDKPVGSGLAKHLGRMVEDAMPDYPGGTAKADLAKGHPGFSDKLYELIDGLATEQAIRLPIIQRPPWKTIELGTQPNADGYRKALKQNGFRISDWANDIMDKPAFTVANQPETIDLVFVTVAELGFPDGATRKDIYEKALSLGLSLCPPEVGSALRLAYPDQPNGEWIFIGMEPITDSDGDLNVFCVARADSDQWLLTDCADPDSVWRSSFRWVFCRRK
ncbi:MAG: hypothetical protein V1719_01085, partial [Patescibacteria group bacterium]